MYVLMYVLMGVPFLESGWRTLRLNIGVPHLNPVSRAQPLALPLGASQLEGVTLA
jgi:hypothetical protein